MHGVLASAKNRKCKVDTDILAYVMLSSEGKEIAKEMFIELSITKEKREESVVFIDC